jgi:hypothetical protein
LIFKIKLWKALYPELNEKNRAPTPKKDPRIKKATPVGGNGVAFVAPDWGESVAPQVRNEALS